jgi:Ca2+-binding RTX toxin-like protein
VSWTLGANLENLTLTGTSNIDATGNSLDNTLVGNSGRNRLAGGTGDDTYVLDSTTDTPTESANEGTDSVLSSVSWTLGSNFENLTLTGTGNINGTGNAANNVLTGNAGDNKLTGGAGNDTYVMGRGYGADTVVENDSTAGNTDVAQFLSGIAADQIWFRHVGNSLEVSIIGTSDSMTIQKWYVGTANHVEQFKTADGQTLLDSNVQNLVNAMAAFSPPAPGQETLPPEYAAALDPVIAANWQ